MRVERPGGGAMMRLAGLVLALGLLVALAAGTQIPFAATPPNTAAVRLAWRALGEAALHCRTPSAEELARLPVHMRRREICERRLPTFRLVVELDGARVVDERIAPAGSAGDRAAVVLRELPVAPGAHRLRIEFAAEGEAPGPPKRLDQRVVLGAGQVALAMEDPETRGLVLRGGSH
jgi:hypothetical protein